MKQQIDKNQNRLPRFSWRTLLLTLVPAILWFAAVLIRPYIIHPRCMDRPQNCTKESVLPIDRLSLGMEDWKADEYSYFTQNFSGTLAVLVPTGWTIGLLALGQIHSITALAFIGADLITVFQTAAWNGLFTEVSHLISQRPRPFVYQDPLQRGIDPAHYTSFYSGHTSFTAAVNMATFLILLSRNAPLLLVLLYAAMGESLIISTAYFRILAGRHFLTDVICGAIAGLFIAWIVSRYRKKAP